MELRFYRMTLPIACIWALEMKDFNSRSFIVICIYIILSFFYLRVLQDAAVLLHY